MKKLFLTTLVLVSLFTMAQKQYHLDIESPFLKEEINLNDGKHHILTEEMLEPFKTTEIDNLQFIQKSKISEIKLNIQKIKLIDYHYENNNFYYNPIIYKF